MPVPLYVLSVIFHHVGVVLMCGGGCSEVWKGGGTMRYEGFLVTLDMCDVMGHTAGNLEPVPRVWVHQGLKMSNPYPYPSVPYP